MSSTCPQNADGSSSRSERADEACYQVLDRRSPFGNLSVADVEMRPGLEVEHRHTSIHLCFVLRGSFHQQFSKHTKTLTRSTVRVSPPGVPARLKFSDSGARCFFLQFSDMLPKDRKFLAPERATFLPDSRSTALARKAYDAFRTEGEAPLVLDTLILELFARAVRPEDGVTGLPPGWLQRAREWVHDCYHLPLELSDAAVDSDVTPVHLSRAFRQHFGCTMGDYLRAVRLDHVRRALEEREISLAQAAVEAGFYDQSHMTRIFSRSFGMTPGAYRKAIDGSVNRSPMNSRRS